MTLHSRNPLVQFENADGYAPRDSLSFVDAETTVDDWRCTSFVDSDVCLTFALTKQALTDASSDAASHVASCCCETPKWEFPRGNGKPLARRDRPPGHRASEEQRTQRRDLRHAVDWNLRVLAGASSACLAIGAPEVVGQSMILAIDVRELRL